LSPGDLLHQAEVQRRDQPIQGRRWEFLLASLEIREQTPLDADLLGQFMHGAPGREDSPAEVAEESRLFRGCVDLLKMRDVLLFGRQLFLDGRPPPMKA
jgi:hypothetical protein